MLKKELKSKEAAMCPVSDKPDVPADANSLPKDKSADKPKILKKAVLYFSGAILIGSAIQVAIMAIQILAIPGGNKPVTLTDALIVDQMRATIKRNYTNPVTINSVGPTKLYLYDCGAVDQDVVSINGMRVTLPPASTPLEVVLPSPVAGIEIQSLDDGSVGPTTLGIKSELESVSCIGLHPGERTVIPTVISNNIADTVLK